jgi:hypothetical protein
MANKYKNVKTEIDGIKFDSKKEAKRYVDLREQERYGIIKNLELQPEFLLQGKFEKNGIKHRAIKYKADFSYVEDEKMIVEDVKGFKTEIFKIKQKLFEFKFQGLTLRLT